MSAAELLGVVLSASLLTLLVIALVVALLEETK
jgi:hypothetical protein